MLGMLKGSQEVTECIWYTPEHNAVIDEENK